MSKNTKLIIVIVALAAMIGLSVYSITKEGGWDFGKAWETQEQTADQTVKETEEVQPQTQTQTQEETETEEETIASTGYTVVIDPGHQAHQNADQEPIGPGAAETKKKVTSGTAGNYTGVAEHEVNLTVSQKLKEELAARGYEVVRTRGTADVDLSNSERAAIANESGDIFVRIHCNSSTNTSAQGALTISPTPNNPYVGEMYQSCRKLSDSILEGMTASSGCLSQGVMEVDNMSGINWCQIPVTIVEMGYMSNQTEDYLLVTDEYQNKMAQGIANGIDAYFGITRE